MSYFKNIKTRAASEEGFSLIELLVVVLIIGILATIMIPRFLGQRDSANNSKVINVMKNAEQNLSSYFTSHDESFCAPGTATCRADLVTARASMEPSITWSGAGNGTTVAGTTLASDPGTASVGSKTVVLGIPVTGRYGGVSFCANGQGTKQYCGVVLGNAAGPQWTVSAGAAGAGVAKFATLPVVAAGSTTAKATPNADETPLSETGAPTAGAGAVLSSGWNN